MNYKYKVDYTNEFKREYKKIKNQGRKIEKIQIVIDKIACGKILDEKYKDHKLKNSKKFKDCRECHIEPDLLLVYRIFENEIVLLLVEIGSHSELFN